MHVFIPTTTSTLTRMYNCLFLLSENELALFIQCPARISRSQCAYTHAELIARPFLVLCYILCKSSVRLHLFISIQVCYLRMNVD